MKILLRNVFLARYPLLLFFFIINIEQLTAQENYPLRPPAEGFQYIELIKGADNGKLPLLIAFHFSSGTPAGTLPDYDSLKNPVRIIIPKGNYLKRGGFSYYPPDYYQKDSMIQFRLSKITVDSIAAFVKAIEKKYGQKAVVSGISQGGDIAFMLAVYHPGICKASFPFAAVIHSGLIDEVRSKPVKKIPIHLFQGEADEIVRVDVTRFKVSRLSHPLQLKCYTYAGLGHDISPAMKSDYSRLIDQINER